MVDIENTKSTSRLQTRVMSMSPEDNSRMAASSGFQSPDSRHEMHSYMSNKQFKLPDDLGQKKNKFSVYLAKVKPYIGKTHKI